MLLFGSRSAANRNAYNCSYFPENLPVSRKIRYDFGDSATASDVQNLANDVLSGWTSIETNGNTLMVTGEGESSQTIITQLPSATNSLPIFLFAINTNGTPSQNTTPVKISNCKLYSGQTLVRDFIPVRVGRFGYLFDRVTGKFFANQGTGDFLLGPDIGTFPGRLHPMGVSSWGAGYKPYDAEVEWLESTGTQYINTLSVSTNNDTIVATVQMPTITNKTGVFGYRTSATSDFCIMQTGSEGKYNVYFSNGSDYATYATGSASGDQTRTTNRVRLTASASLREVYDLDSMSVLASNTAQMSTAFQTAGNCLLLRNGGNPFATASFVGRVFSLVWTRNGVLVRDFIPVRIGSVGYLYDRANPTGGPLGNGLYPNAGSGAFIIGPDIS